MQGEAEQHARLKADGCWSCWGLVALVSVDPRKDAVCITPSRLPTPQGRCTLVS